MSENIFRDVATRTNGEVFLGVVGSVRSGKSTFIRRFMEKKVLPLIVEQDVYHKVLDELPQSGDGKTIMTVEPKFIPSNYVTINCDDISFSVRLVDCVGYLIPSAKGYLNEDGTPRMIKTPWYENEVEFKDAATLGTKKVIEAHSHIGIILTSDGSFSEFSEDEYENVLEEVVGELQIANKPFVIVYNTLYPKAEHTLEKIEDLRNRYGVTVKALDVDKMTENDIDELLKEALNEFPIQDLEFDMPTWVENLSDDLNYKHEFNDLLQSVKKYSKMKEVFLLQETLMKSNLFESVHISEIDPSNGTVVLELNVNETVYNNCIEEILGEHDVDKGRLIEILLSYRENIKICDKLGPALKTLESQGYGIALPKIEDMTLETPELSKQAGRYGIKIKATAPAIYLVKVDVESLFEPIIGSKEQSEALIEHMCQNGSESLWESEIFGRKLCDVINDGVKAKVMNIPEIVQFKYRDAINKVVNKSKGGVIAIVL